MGESHQLNQSHGRVMNNDDIIWSGVNALQRVHNDGFPFTAEDVVRATGNQITGCAITRDRHGLEQWHRTQRQQMTDALADLVNGYDHSDIGFFIKLAQIIVDYRRLFENDIVALSYRNTGSALGQFKALIREAEFSYFAADFYLLLMDWYGERFARSLITEKYATQIQSIFRKYHIEKRDVVRA